MTRRLGRQFLDSIVIDKHPFNWLSGVQLETNNKILLVGWREISKEEYNMYPNLELKEIILEPGHAEAILTGQKIKTLLIWMIQRAKDGCIENWAELVGISADSERAKVVYEMRYPKLPLGNAYINAGNFSLSSLDW